MTVSLGKWYLQNIWSFRFFFLTQMMVIQRKVREGNILNSLINDLYSPIGRAMQSGVSTYNR